MTFLYPIKFAFGYSIPVDYPISHIEYYLNFFSNLLSKSFSIKPELEGTFKTIPIVEDTAQFSQVFINEFNTIISATYGISLNSKLKDNRDIIVIDLRGLIRSLNLLHLTNEIANILKNESHSNQHTRFALIIESVEESDKVLRPIESYIVSKKVFVIDLKNRCLFGSLKPNIKNDFNFENITKSPIEKIKYKLIRKIGHFERRLNNIHHACNQYFYDGSYCINDLKNLIVDLTLKLYKKESFNINKIVYHCPESPWLKDALYKAHVELTRLKKLHNLDYSSKEDLMELSKGSRNKLKVLLIVDLIHSGETFKEIYKDFKSKFPNSKIKAISILNSGNQVEHEINGNFRKIYISANESIDVEFFLTVQQFNYPTSYHNCPMCKYDLLPKVNSTYFGKDYLLSYEMWHMCDNAGYKTEDFQPVEERHKIDYMPHTLKIMEYNAPYLAYKFDKIIQNESFKNSTELILVFPDETSNELELKLRGGTKINLEDTPSGYFAESLKQLKEYHYFSIPREVIRKVNKGLIELSEISTKYPDFYKSLKRLPDDIIVFDEMNNSGGTISTIIEILRIVNKKPIAFFPIFNFSPSTINSESLNGIPVFSLYQFDLKQPISYV